MVTYTEFMKENEERLEVEYYTKIGRESPEDLPLDDDTELLYTTNDFIEWCYKKYEEENKMNEDKFKEGDFVKVLKVSDDLWKSAIERLGNPVGEILEVTSEKGREGYLLDNNKYMINFEEEWLELAAEEIEEGDFIKIVRWSTDNDRLIRYGAVEESIEMKTVFEVEEVDYDGDLYIVSDNEPSMYVSPNMVEKVEKPKEVKIECYYEGEWIPDDDVTLETIEESFIRTGDILQEDTVGNYEYYAPRKEDDSGIFYSFLRRIKKE